ncbi:phospholipase D-like domain-containing protein [Sorangium sp. So ce269]
MEAYAARVGGVFIAVAVVVVIAVVIAVGLSRARSCREAAWSNFLREVWTFGLPKPDMYYDPRTAMPGPPWASLHGKCIVVDEERTLITSANFTDRGQTRNIEAGVLIDDGPFAEEVSAQWRLLIRAGLVRRYRG